jgi:hypothetical protein
MLVASNVGAGTPTPPMKFTEALTGTMTQIQDLSSALTVAQLLSAGRVESDHLAATLRFV